MSSGSNWFFPDVRVQLWNPELKTWTEAENTYTVAGAFRKVRRRMLESTKASNWRIIDTKGRHFYVRSSHLK